MERRYIVTYATHPQGFFNELVNNKYGAEVIVLGMNTKWNGFFDKIRGVKEFCDQLTDRDIVIFVDGFDTIINRNPNDVYDRFKEFNCDILLSKDLVYDSYPMRYITKKVFGTCNDTLVNSGLYMGYAKPTRDMLEQILVENTTDDQRALNSVCNSLVNYKIDTEKVIFNNTFYNPDDLTESYFVSYPAATAFGVKERMSRYKRGLVEYTPFLWNEIIIIVSIIIIVLFMMQKK